MLERVVLLDGKSGYDVFHYWLEMLQQQFAAKGLAAPMVSIQQEDAAVAGSDSISFGFNLIRNWRQDAGDHLHVMWMVDPPPYHGHFFIPQISRMPVQPERCLVACVDAGWAEFIRTFYGFERVLFLPHACAKMPDAAQLRPHETRKRSAIFVGSLHDPQQILKQIRQQAGKQEAQIEQLLEMCVAQGSAALLRVLPAFAEQLGMEPAQQAVFVNRLYPLFDQFIRNRERMQWLSAIHETPLNIYGEGDWGRFVWGRNVVLHDAVSFSDVPAILQRSRVLLNHSPVHSQGLHERIVEALAHGTSVLTTPSAYVEECFGDDPAVQCCELPDDEQLARMMDTPPSAARATVLRDHMFSNRVEQLLSS